VLNLTREQLARRIGCSTSAIYKIETDARQPSRQVAELLAKCLDIPPDQHPMFLQVAHGQLRVERLESLLSVPVTLVSGPTLSCADSSLPTLPTPLIGRGPELATLSQLLCDPQCQLLTLAGLGGMGKTHLALEVAHRHRELFADGVCFVSLAPLASPESIVPAIADALVLTFYGSTDPKTCLLNHLREKCCSWCWITLSICSRLPGCWQRFWNSRRR